MRQFGLSGDCIHFYSSLHFWSKVFCHFCIDLPSGTSDLLFLRHRLEEFYFKNWGRCRSEEQCKRHIAALSLMAHLTGGLRTASSEPNCVSTVPPRVWGQERDSVQWALTICPGGTGEEKWFGCVPVVPGHLYLKQNTDFYNGINCCKKWKGK